MVTFENIINRPLGKINPDIIKKCRRLMMYRRSFRKKNISFYQQKAFDIIKTIIKNKKVVTEKLVFCDSTKRFYLIDIYIPYLRLCIELDGKQHLNNREYDLKRENAMLNDWGIITIRFMNNEVISGTFKKVMTSVIIEQNHKKIHILDKDLSLPHNWCVDYC